MATTISAPTTAATCLPTPRRRTVVAPKRTGRSSLPTSLRPTQNTSTALAAYDVLSDLPVQPTVRGGSGRGRPARGTTAARDEDGKLHLGQGAAVRLPPAWLEDVSSAAQRAYPPQPG
jgi:hypothetical protein